MDGDFKPKLISFFCAASLIVQPMGISWAQTNQKTSNSTRSIGFVEAHSRSLSSEQKNEVREIFRRELSSMSGFRLAADSEIQSSVVKKNPLVDEVEKFKQDQKKRQAEIRTQLEASRKAYLASEFDFARETLEKALAGCNDALWGLNAEMPFQILESLAATEFFLGNEERAKFLVAGILDLDPSYVIDSQNFPPEFSDLFNEVRLQSRFPLEWVKLSSQDLENTKVSFIGQRVASKNDNGFYVEILKGHPLWGKKGLVIDREGFAPLLFDLHQLPSELEFVSLGDRTISTAGLLTPIGSATPSPQLKTFMRSTKLDLYVLASVERLGSGDFQVDVQWIENQSLRSSPVVVAVADSLERSIERAVSELFDYISPSGYVMAEKLVMETGEPTQPEKKSFWSNWWAWAIVGVAVVGAGAGGYLLLRPEDNLRVQVQPAQ